MRENAHWQNSFAHAGKCMSEPRALLFCKLSTWGSDKAIEKKKIIGSISIFMKATIPGTHGMIIEKPQKSREVSIILLLIFYFDKAPRPDMSNSNLCAGRKMTFKVKNNCKRAAVRKWSQLFSVRKSVSSNLMTKVDSCGRIWQEMGPHAARGLPVWHAWLRYTKLGLWCQRL